MSQEFGAVLAAGLAILGLFFVVSQADTDFGIQPQKESMELFSRNYGKLGQARSDSRTVNFGSFSVGEARGNILVERRDSIKVEAKLFDRDTYTAVYNATQPRTGTVEFEVLGRTGRGKVYVRVNGEKVFEQPLISGGDPKVKIPANALRSGQNEIKIGTTKGGLLSSSEYRLEDVKIRVNDRKFHDYVNTFKIYQYELEDYLEGTLTFRVGNAVKSKPLKVYINDQQVYSFSTIRGAKKVRINPQNADLRNGLNVIEFKTDGKAKYQIENAALTVRYVGATRPVLVRQEFNLNETQLNFAEKNGTAESMSFSYRNLLGSPNNLILDVNGVRKTTIPSNGKNEISLGRKLLEKTNVMIIRSNGTFLLNNVKVVSGRDDN